MISIIIPVYKVELYLRKCVDSILCQTYRDFEIILVDDGSPDNSPVICDEYCTKDYRVKVVHKENGGLSDARNVGLKRSSGDYVIFVDGDDWWAHENCLQMLVQEQEKVTNCDFIGFNCSYYYQETNKEIPWKSYSDQLLQETDPSRCVQLLIADGLFPMSACMKMLNRSFLINNNLFKEGIIGEDIPWFIDVLYVAKKCCFVNLYMYMYTRGVESSITAGFSLKKYTDLFTILKDGIAHLDTFLWDKKTKDALLSFWAYEYCILSAQLGKIKDKDVSFQIVEELKKYHYLLSYDLNPKVHLIHVLNRICGWRTTRWLLSIYMKFFLK